MLDLGGSSFQVALPYDPAEVQAFRDREMARWLEEREDTLEPNPDPTPTRTLHHSHTQSKGADRHSYKQRQKKERMACTYLFIFKML